MHARGGRSEQARRTSERRWRLRERRVARVVRRAVRHTAQVGRVRKALPEARVTLGTVARGDRAGAPRRSALPARTHLYQSALLLHAGLP